ncbi:hypothetical protein C8Q76DRAFT_469544 [Earliella scabrosa]|nr:hypothetical protein C8Q76DRAFT_469544 [Earliella scabrosa]
MPSSSHVRLMSSLIPPFLHQSLFAMLPCASALNQQIGVRDHVWRRSTLPPRRSPFFSSLAYGQLKLLSALGPARHLLRPLSAMHRRFSGVLPSWNLEHSIHIRSKRQPGDGETGGQHCQ